MVQWMEKEFVWGKRNEERIILSVEVIVNSFN